MPTSNTKCIPAPFSQQTGAPKPPRVLEIVILHPGCSLIPNKPILSPSPPQITEERCLQKTVLHIVFRIVKAFIELYVSLNIGFDLLPPSS